MVSWYGFAELILDRAVTSPYVDMTPERRPSLRAIASNAYPFRAPRQIYTALSSRSAQKAFGVGLPAWQEQLETCLRSMQA